MIDRMKLIDDLNAGLALIECVDMAATALENPSQAEAIRRVLELACDRFQTVKHGLEAQR